MRLAPHCPLELRMAAHAATEYLRIGLAAPPLAVALRARGDGHLTLCRLGLSYRRVGGREALRLFGTPAHEGGMVPVRACPLQARAHVA
jgi:hypothetical protein